MKARVLITAALVVASCAHAGLNRSDSRGAHENDVHATDVPVRGFQVSVETASSTESGELIAIDEQFLYVNASDSPAVWAGERIARAQVVKVTVEVGPSASGTLGIWTAMGCLSTASHGVFLVFTGPIWLATGIPASAGESAAAKAVANPDQLSQLYQYARFPQGLPPSFGGAPRQPRDGGVDWTVRWSNTGRLRDAASSD
jgi:hypothetical protein